MEKQFSKLSINSGDSTMAEEANEHYGGTDSDKSSNDENSAPSQAITNNFIDVFNNKGNVTINIHPDEKRAVLADDFYSTPEQDKLDRGSRNVHNTGTNTSRALNFDFPHGPQQWSNVGKIRRRKQAKGKLPFPIRKNWKKIDRKVHHEINVNIRDNSGTVSLLVIEGQQDEVVEHDGPSSEAPYKHVSPVADELYQEKLVEIYETMNQLHPLRDNCKWDEFHLAVIKKVEFARANNKRHVEILLSIETSITLSYKKDFEGSQKSINEAYTMLKSMSNIFLESFLIAYLCCHETALHRRKNNSLLTEASRSIVIAEQNVELTPFCIIKAFAAYERASNSTKMLSLINVHEDERVHFYEESKKELRECISVCEKVLHEDGSIYLVRQHFALIKLALMNLNCRTKASRSQPVSYDELREAQRCIRRIESLYEGQVKHNQSLLVLLYTAQSDLCFREGQFDDARALALKALERASAAGLKLEIKYIQERLDDINELSKMAC